MFARVLIVIVRPLPGVSVATRVPVFDLVFLLGVALSTRGLIFGLVFLLGVLVSSRAAVFDLALFIGVFGQFSLSGVRGLKLGDMATMQFGIRMKPEIS